MRASIMYIDERAWWQQPSRLIAATALPLAVLAAIWWAATTTVSPEPVVRRASPPLPTTPAPVQPAPTAAATAPPSAAQPFAMANTPMAPPTPPSIMVAPGVHLTPLSVPAGTAPLPAGPSEHDSEPEN